MRVAELVERGERIGDYEELKILIGKIEEFRGSPIYLSLKDRIKNLKVKLANNDLQSYQQTNLKMIEEELLKCGVKTEEIDQAAQKAFDKLNTVKDLPAEEIDNSKEIISVSVRTKSAEKQLDRFIKQFDDGHDKIAKKRAKKKILQFISNKNTFNQKAAVMRKEKLDAILGNHNQELDLSPKRVKLNYEKSQKTTSTTPVSTAFARNSGIHFGLRVSEAISLDLELNHPELEYKDLYLLRGKRKKDRYVYIAPEIVEILKKYAPHTLRRCFATYNLLAGMPLNILQKVLGHKKLETMHNLELLYFYLVTIAYDGSDFAVSILAASRTDKGVHAQEQKFTLRLNLSFSSEKLFNLLKKAFGGVVLVKKVQKVDNNFHPIRSVFNKEYRYFINVGKCNIFQKKYR
ncbi:10744_t:CDS:2 [Funneliformis geosporum]|uniref:10744_t:CDS:1 n=1 Tax=Funneliformis geosporum TaxID=1117311 RepID=A0A9W4SCB8_9GLOM|nr:10744_t:CDS:2 [Funneliformis geosporum]